MKYEAVLLSSEFPKGRKAGQVYFDNHSLLFYIEDEIYKKVPLSDLKLDLGGAASRLIFFIHTKLPEFSIQIADKSVLKEEDLRVHYHLTEDVKSINKKITLFQLSLLSVVIVGVLMIVSFFIFRKELVNIAVNHIPTSIDKSIGENAFDHGYSQALTFIKNDSVDNYVQTMVTPLLVNVNQDDFNFRFFVIKEESINAFALPGGTIVIHSGLIDKSNSIEQVQGVLAHEISHVTQRHQLKSMVGQIGLVTFIQFFIGDASGLVNQVMAMSSKIEQLAYSREFEKDADDTGYALLEKANIDPVGMIEFFQILDQEHEVNIPEFLTTHPDVKNRIKSLKEKNNKGPYVKQNVNEFNNFKILIKQLIQ